MCGGPIDLGTLTVGSATSTTISRLPSSGQEEWYLVRFPMNPDYNQHGTGTARVSFSVNDGNIFRFDVRATCASNAPCGSGSASGITSYAFQDRACASNDCVNRSTSWPTSLLIRVHRTTGGVSCGRYRLAVSR